MSLVREPFLPEVYYQDTKCVDPRCLYLEILSQLKLLSTTLTQVILCPVDPERRIEHLHHMSRQKLLPRTRKKPK